MKTPRQSPKIPPEKDRERTARQPRIPPRARRRAAGRKGERRRARAKGGNGQRDAPGGLMPGMGYEEKETILEAGEAALFYSDGLVEAHDAKGEMFGFPRLRALIAEHGEERALGDLLLKQLYTFVGESWEQEDDITLVTQRRAAARRCSTHLDA